MAAVQRGRVIGQVESDAAMARIVGEQVEKRA
jgi:hypothetical protein